MEPIVIASVELLIEFREEIAKMQGGSGDLKPDQGSFSPRTKPQLVAGQAQLDLAALRAGILTLVYLDSRSRISHTFDEEGLSAAEKARILNKDPEALSAPAMPIDPAILGGQVLTRDRNGVRTKSPQKMRGQSEFGQ